MSTLIVYVAAGLPAIILAWLVWHIYTHWKVVGVEHGEDGEVRLTAGRGLSIILSGDCFSEQTAWLIQLGVKDPLMPWYRQQSVRFPGYEGGWFELHCRDKAFVIGTGKRMIHIPKDDQRDFHVLINPKFVPEDLASRVNRSKVPYRFSDVIGG